MPELSKSNIKLLPLGAMCNKQFTSEKSPVTEIITDIVFEKETGLKPEYKEVEVNKIVYLKSTQHTVIKLPTVDEGARLWRKYSNVKSGNRLDQSVENIEVETKEINGVFSSGFSSCGFQIAYFIKDGERFLLLSHLQSGSAIQAVADDLDLSITNDVVWVLNTTICNEGSVIQCYGSGELKNNPDKVLNLIRGDNLFPNKNELLQSFALISTGVMFNDIGNMKLYWTGGKPPATNEHITYVAKTVRDAKLHVPPNNSLNVPFKLSNKLSLRELKSLFRGYIEAGYVVDFWNIYSITDSQKWETFVTGLTELLAAGDSQQAKQLVITTFGEDRSSLRNNMRTSRYLTPDEISQWVIGAPFASANYAKL